MYSSINLVYVYAKLAIQFFYYIFNVIFTNSVPHDKLNLRVVIYFGTLFKETKP